MMITSGTAMPMVAVMTGCIFTGMIVLIAAKAWIKPLPDEAGYKEDTSIVM